MSPKENQNTLSKRHGTLCQTPLYHLHVDNSQIYFSPSQAPSLTSRCKYSAAPLTYLKDTSNLTSSKCMSWLGVPCPHPILTLYALWLPQGLPKGMYWKSLELTELIGTRNPGLKKQGAWKLPYEGKIYQEAAPGGSEFCPSAQELYYRSSRCGAVVNASDQEP